MRQPGSTDPGSGVGGVGKVSVGGLRVARDEPGAAVESGRASLAAVATESPGAFATAARGVTASVHDAGIVAQRAGTETPGGGVVSAAVRDAASCALPALSHAKAANAESAAAAVSEATRRLLSIIVDQ